MAKITKAEKDELLAKAATVLEEVLAEYESLEKMDTEELQDPSRMKKEDEMAKPEEAAAFPEASEEEKEEDDEKEEDEEKEDDEKEESDEDLMRSIEALQAKAKARGLAKSEAAPAAAPSEDLKKSIDDRFETLSKTVSQMAETISKIAAQPVSRKGVAGYAPLKKSEGGEELSKSEVIGKLLKAQGDGDKRVNASLINRVETNRASAQDFEFIKGIVG